jgi:hypothetical protein
MFFLILKTPKMEEIREVFLIDFWTAVAQNNFGNETPVIFSLKDRFKRGVAQLIATQRGGGNFEEMGWNQLRLALDSFAFRGRLARFRAFMAAYLRGGRESSSSLDLPSLHSGSYRWHAADDEGDILQHEEPSQAFQRDVSEAGRRRARHEEAMERDASQKRRAEMDPFTYGFQLSMWQQDDNLMRNLHAQPISRLQWLMSKSPMFSAVLPASIFQNRPPRSTRSRK